MGEKGLWALKNKNIVDGLNDCSLEVDFEHCIYGKDNHVQFYYYSHKSSRLLDLIHFDIFGQVKFIFISKDLYYVSFIDDYSRRTWAYFLELNMRFLLGLRSLNISWKIRLVGRLWCCGLIMSMSFFPIEFDKFFKENGIERHKKPPYTP
jgi:hypothetical protein